MAVYCDTLSTIIFLPLSLIFPRSDRPSLTISIFCKFFLLGIFGSSAQIFGYAGLQCSSPTLGTAILNLMPAFTFILAIIFRLEKMDWRSKSSLAKAFGTVVSISGAFVATLYKGIPIIRTYSSLTELQVHIHFLHLTPRLSWILGGCLITGEALMDSAVLILQAFILKKFPALFIMMFYHFLFVTILSAIYSLFLVDHPSAWILRLDIGLVAIMYGAVVGLVFRIGLCAWCLWKTGPLFVSMFKPLGIIFAVIMDVIFVGDALCLGSLIGAIIIVTGFYAVMWGKAKEEKTSKDSESQSSENSPLLQTQVEEI